jgi:hypothetical protein
MIRKIMLLPSAKKFNSIQAKLMLWIILFICYCVTSKSAFAETDADSADTYIILVKQKDLADDMYEKIIQEKSESRFSKFSEFAKSSIDPSSNAKSGSIGYVMKGQFPKEVESEIFALPLDGYSKPIKTEYGWLILHVKEKKSDAVKNFCIASLNDSIQNSPSYEKIMLEHGNIETTSDNFLTIIKTILTGEWGGPFVLDEKDLVFFSKKKLSETNLYEVVLHTELKEPQYAALIDSKACYRSAQLKTRVDCGTKKVAYMDERRFEGRGAIGRVVRDFPSSSAEPSYTDITENTLGWYIHNYACVSN